MTGFIRGLFSKKSAEPKSKEAFFLDADDAKTFGNIDYMREMKTVEHKFPNGRRKTQVRKISSVDYLRMDEQVGSRNVNFTTTPSKPSTSFGNTSQSSFGKPQASFGQSKASFSTPSTPASKAQEPSASAPSEPKPKEQQTAKRGPDTSMDMFRSMAKNIRK